MKMKLGLTMLVCIPALLAAACGGEAESNLVASANAGATPMGGEAAEAIDMSEAAAECLGCHAGPLGFAGQDEESVAAANEKGMSLLFAEDRHFRH